MLWGDGDGVKNPIGATYSDDRQIKDGVKDQLKDKDSMLNHYSKLIAIRHKYPAIARGDYSTLTSGNSCLGGFAVDYKGESLFIIHNTSDEQISISLSELEGLGERSVTALCDYVGSGVAKLKDGKLVIDGKTSAILQ
jgi:glycosidase